jgi:flagellar hook-associated protein 1 FlgK
MGMGMRGFDIAISGLRYNERALSVTSHNITNVNTNGYVRQQAISTSAMYDTIGENMQIGLGADIEQIRQIRNEFMDKVYRKELSTLGYWDSRKKTIEDLQSILGEPMWDGLQDFMNSFWDSWQELAKQPDNLTIRALVRQRGEALVHQANHIGNQIYKLQDDLNTEIQVRINEVNQISKDLAMANINILKGEINGDQANDFRDQRNSLLDRLSELINIETIEGQDGQIDVTAAGYYLVSKGISTNLYAGQSTTSGLFYVPMVEGSIQEVPITGGEIKGLLEARGEVEGLTSSIENGSPNTKADITFVVDNSDTSIDNLNRIKNDISNYLSDLNNRGLDYNLRLITYDAAATASVDYGSNYQAFATAVNAITSTASTGNDFNNVITELTNVDTAGNYIQDANRYAIVFTGESIDGDGTAAVPDPPTAFIDALNAIDMNTLVVTDSAYFNTGDGGAGETTGWDRITEGTGGALFDIQAVNYNDLFVSINEALKNDVNFEMSNVEENNNIIPTMLTRLNSIINIMAREVNYLQKNGVTLGDQYQEGRDFFVPNNGTIPLQMGNIKVNAELSELDMIAAGKTGDDGDNTIALDIANLRSKTFFRDDKGIISSDDYYQTVILKVGAIGAEATRIAENQKSLVDSSDHLRKSIMKVSLDEEVSNMMKYKFAYGASAKLLGVLDEMLVSIISKVGLVGR